MAPRGNVQRLILAQLEEYWQYWAVVNMSQNNYYYLAPLSLASNIFCFAVLFKGISKSTA